MVQSHYFLIPLMLKIHVKITGNQFCESYQLIMLKI